MTTSFEQTAKQLLVNHQRGAAIAKTFATIDAFVAENDWEGACHATSAVAFVLLRAQGIEAMPCLGELAFGAAATDHSWIEIDDAVFDVAIARPLVPEFARPPVLAGRHIHDGSATQLVYGATSGIAPMASATAVARLSIGQYMDGFPAHVDGLWGIVSELGATMGLSLNVRELRTRYGSARWVTKPEPVRSPDEDRRERNRRKRSRQGR